MLIIKYRPTLRRRTAHLSRALAACRASMLAAVFCLSAGAVHAAVSDAPDFPSAGATAPHTVHPRRDGWITAKVKSKILAISVNKGAGVHVTTFHGVVTLKGNVIDPVLVTQFKRAAEAVDGVKRVDVSGLVARPTVSSDGTAIPQTLPAVPFKETAR